MKVSFSVKNAKFCRSYSQSNDFSGYWATEDLIKDFTKIVEYHELKFEKYKNEYIKQWGEDSWNQHVESYKWAEKEEGK